MTTFALGRSTSTACVRSFGTPISTWNRFPVPPGGRPSAYRCRSQRREFVWVPSPPNEQPNRCAMDGCSWPWPVALLSVRDTHPNRCSCWRRDAIDVFEDRAVLGLDVGSMIMLNISRVGSSAHPRPPVNDRPDGSPAQTAGSSSPAQRRALARQPGHVSLVPGARPRPAGRTNHSATSAARTTAARASARPSASTSITSYPPAGGSLAVPRQICTCSW